MTEECRGVESSRAAGWAAGVLAWLVGCPRGRWATAKGRCVRMVMTAGLLVTALGAWMLAIVQPGWRRPEALGAPLPSWPAEMRTVQADPDADPDRLQRLWAKFETPDSACPCRDPFARTDALEEVARLVLPPAVEPGAAPAAPASSETARELLDAIRAMHLKITLVAPDGATWAVIDGSAYREGDRVGGMEIVEIQEGRVKLRKAGIQCLLRMD